MLFPISGMLVLIDYAVFFLNGTSNMGYNLWYLKFDETAYFTLPPKWMNFEVCC